MRYRITTVSLLVMIIASGFQIPLVSAASIAKWEAGYNAWSQVESAEGQKQNEDEMGRVFRAQAGSQPCDRHTYPEVEKVYGDGLLNNKPIKPGDGVCVHAGTYNKPEFPLIGEEQKPTTAVSPEEQAVIEETLYITSSQYVVVDDSDNQARSDIEGQQGVGLSDMDAYEHEGNYVFLPLVVRAEPKGGFPAFPGAEGAGAYARGGRGGRVLKVTRLDDTGSDTEVGTLRWALRQSGPRIVVFDVGGTIELTKPIRIARPYLTIAGQTAPGGGITVKNYQLIILTHDVVVRYLRFRPGDEKGLDEIHGLSIGNRPDVGADVVGHDIIIDHCSLSWAADDTLGIWNVNPEMSEIYNVTIQWSIVSEALNRLLMDSGEPQGLAMVMGPGDGVTNISIHHNLFAHNMTRNPRINGGHHEVINNIFYNNMLDTKLTTDKAKTFLNYVGNYAIDGPNTYAYRHMLYVVPDDTIGPPYTAYRYEPEIFVQGNMGRFRTLPTDDDWSIVGQGLYGPSDPANRNWQASAPHPMPGIPVTIQSCREAFNAVLAKAGASLVRDAVDERVTDEVRDRTGRQIGSQDEVGGWPNLAAGSPPTDTDHDGMPDGWETQRGLDPSQDDSAGDRDSDGYTNIEEYINFSF